MQNINSTLKHLTGNKFAKTLAHVKLHEYLRKFATYQAGPLSTHQYCLNLIKKYDYENFLCTLLLPAELRASVVATRAFNVEIAQIQDQVSQKSIGQMRVQFWYETLNSIFSDKPPQQPVAIELHKAVRRHKLSKTWLRRLVQSREEGLSRQAYANLTEVEAYGENTVASLHYLTLECLGIKDVHSDHAASHIGKAQGIVTMLRSVPFHAQRQRVFLPVEDMVKHGVSQQAIIRGRNDQNVRDLVYEIACKAHQHLEKARSIKYASNGFPVMLYAVPTQQYLSKLQKLHFDVFDPQMQQRNSMLPWHLWWKRLRRQF